MANVDAGGMHAVSWASNNQANRDRLGKCIGCNSTIFIRSDQNAPLGSNATLQAVGGTAVYLVSDAAAYTTGEIIHVDGGFHVMGMPKVENI